MLMIKLRNFKFKLIETLWRNKKKKLKENFDWNSEKKL